MGKKEDRKILRELEQNAFLIKSECTISLVTSKLQIINSELSLALGRKVIHSISGRTKTAESTRLKLLKKGYEVNLDNAMNKLSDLVGVRAVCSFEDDIYRIADILLSHADVKLVKEKDYIKKPKISGYRSLHLIVKVPIYFAEGAQWVKAEIQLRTSAMNFWADLDHQLRYKKGHKEAELIGEELKNYSGAIAAVDERMVELREKIDAIP